MKKALDIREAGGAATRTGPAGTVAAPRRKQLQQRPACQALAPDCQASSRVSATRAATVSGPALASPGLDRGVALRSHASHHGETGETKASALEGVDLLELSGFCAFARACLASHRTDEQRNAGRAVPVIGLRRLRSEGPAASRQTQSSCEVENGPLAGSEERQALCELQELHKCGLLVTWPKEA